MNYGAPRQNTSPLITGLLAACGGCAVIFILGIVLLVQAFNRSPIMTTIRADSLMRHKRYPEAEKALLKVVAKQPEDAMALNQLAWCYYKDDKSAEGEAYAKRAVAIEPNPSYIDTLAHIRSRAKAVC